MIITAASCGVYAAAFALELASGVGACKHDVAMHLLCMATSLDVDFGSSQDMHRHLARCFEANEAMPFANVIVKKRGRKAHPRVVIS